MTLQSQGGNYTDDADGEIRQVQAEYPADEQQEGDNEQWHGNQVQHQVGRVLVIVRVRTPLPGGKVGVTFTHDAYPRSLLNS